MDQQIRFCRVDGRRVAYATVGDGPPLVFGAHWVTHLEEEWADPHARAFYEELARTHRVVRYDRPGTGLSDRRLAGLPTMDLDVRVLDAILDETTEGPAAVFACYCAGLATAVLASSAPERFRKLVFFGGYVSRDDIPEATRRSLVDMVRASWPLAAQMFAGLDLPQGSGEEIRAKMRYQLASAEADVAAGFLELDLTFDARPYLTTVAAPSLVLHRRGDRTVPIRHGRELASLLSNARFVALNGDASSPWMGDQRELQRALAGFLGDDVPVEGNGDSPLTRRETEVLRLVSVGLSNREIASSLVLSEHTVHRHVANILRKLGQSTRAAAAAHATRAGLI